MSRFRFPCRVCGVLTDGVDSYVVCADCLADLQRPSPEYARDRDERGDLSWRGSEPEPAMTEEVAARLRRLLDDW